MGRSTEAVFGHSNRYILTAYSYTFINFPMKKSLIHRSIFFIVLVNLISLAHGLMLGWVSPAMPKLVSKENPPLASGPLTNEQISWVGSLNCIAAIIGAATFGYFTPLIGSKRSLIVLSCPLVAFWLLIYFGQTYYHVLIARFIGGWTASGVQGGTILFVSEISNDEYVLEYKFKEKRNFNKFYTKTSSIRGRLGAVASFTR